MYHRQPLLAFIDLGFEQRNLKPQRRLARNRCNLIGCAINLKLKSRVKARQLQVRRKTERLLNQDRLIQRQLGLRGRQCYLAAINQLGHS